MYVYTANNCIDIVLACEKIYSLPYVGNIGGGKFGE